MANFPLAYNSNHIDNVANVRYFILYYKKGFSSNAENILRGIPYARACGPVMSKRSMAPKQMTQAAIAQLVADEVAKALRNDRANRNAGGAGGQNQ
nr:hypothetical protein [Tanacetum cinerariifolium]